MSMKLENTTVKSSLPSKGVGVSRDSINGVKKCCSVVQKRDLEGAQELTEYIKSSPSTYARSVS